MSASGSERGIPAQRPLCSITSGLVSTRQVGHLTRGSKHALRNSTFICCGMQDAAGILYVHVPSVMSFPVFSSTTTSSLVRYPSPWMKAPSTCAKIIVADSLVRPYVYQAKAHTMLNFQDCNCSVNRFSRSLSAIPLSLHELPHTTIDL